MSGCSIENRSQVPPSTPNYIVAGKTLSTDCAVDSLSNGWSTHNFQNIRMNNYDFEDNSRKNDDDVSDGQVVG